jgi:hypothetical protein
MKKVLIFTSMIASLFLTSFVFANSASIEIKKIPGVGAKADFDSKPWFSNGPTDEVRITNATGSGMLVVINVNQSPTKSGIDIKNCGSIHNVQLHGMVICPLSADPNLPIIFSANQVRTSDFNTSGSYQIHL